MTKSANVVVVILLHGISILAVAGNLSCDSSSRDRPSPEWREHTSIIDQDDPRITHTIYHAYYEGVRLYGVAWIKHQRDNSSFGELRKSITFPHVAVTPALSAEEAGEILANSLETQSSYFISSDLKVENAELVLLPSELPVNSTTTLVLSWVIPTSQAAFIVDANSGVIIRTEFSMRSARNRFTYRITSDPPGIGWACFYPGTPDPGTPVATETTPLEEISDISIQALHRNAGLAYDYFRDVHGRDSWNDTVPEGDEGAEIHIIAATNLTESSWLKNNAAWDGEKYMLFDPDLGIDLSVVGHEFTHAITGAEFSPVYEGESGAISESLSDFFGVRVAQVKGNSSSWELGESIAAGPIRDMAHPSGQPDHLDGFMAPRVDMCELNNAAVHYNSGIVNRALFLLAVGSERQPVHNVVVRGIGVKRTESIVYGAIQRNRFLAPEGALYLSSHAGFADLASALYYVCRIFSDLGLHSISESDCGEVDCAFRAVGIVAECLDYDGNGVCEGCGMNYPSGICLQRNAKVEGEPCDRTDECEYYCIGGLCTGNVWPDGAVCETDGECILRDAWPQVLHYPSCIFGMCSSDEIADGGYCDSDYDCEARNWYNTNYMNYSSCIGNQCLEAVVNGEVCDSDIDCLGGSCYQGICRERVGAGDSCDSNGDCDSSICVRGVCGDSNPIPGRSCDDDSDCTVYSCFNGECRERFENGGGCDSHQDCQSWFCDCGGETCPGFSE